MAFADKHYISSDELELKFKKDGTEEDPASLGWSSEAKAKYYVVSITRKGVIRDDLVIGRKTSLELHYHTLVMENAGTKPEEIGVYADVSAMSDEKVIKKLPTQNLSKFICIMFALNCDCLLNL